MNRIIKYVIVCLCCFIGFVANATIKTINTTYTQTTTITPLSAITQISSLSVKGSVVFNHDSSLVRILVRDASGTEYMVYERYPLCASSKSIAFANEAEETNILLNIKPVSITLVVLNASLTIESFDYSTSVISQTAAQVKQAQVLNLHAKNTNKIALITNNKALYHTNWTAGHTQLSDFTFFVKKRYMGNRIDYNESGYEFYVGGVFRSMSTPYSTLKSGTTSAFVPEFDWRKMHNAHLSTSPYYDGDALGGGWATSVKNQLWNDPLVCGSCWDHAAVALVEMYINLYYNRHVDKDLSEQELISCSQMDCSGGNSFGALAYIKDNGIVEENCFPYVGYEQLCTKKCNTQNKIGITKFNSFGVQDVESIKKWIVARGPITASTETHSMLLVGWKIDENSNTVWILKNSHGLGIGDHGYLFYYPKEIDTYDEFINDGIPTGINETPQCLDKDGDGYYNWGIGSKPSSCPPCAPNDEDWNDNDPTRAIMDKTTGEIKLITSPPIGSETIFTIGYANNFWYWDNEQSPCGNVLVQYPNIYGNGENRDITGLIIRANVNLVANATFTINNCTTKLIGSTIDNANLSVTNNGKLIIVDGGTLKLGSNDKFTVSLGSSLVLSQSKIIVK